MASMLVNPKSARKCCKGCSSEYGERAHGKGKQEFKRIIRHRDKQNFKREVIRNEF
jgi:predicted metal-binding protein